MKTRNKALLALLCAVALVASSVFGTYAYLTSKDTVTNTFTVGNVSITLDEKNVDGKDGDGEEDTADRDKANKYHLLPGQTYTKDPTVTVLANSERSYVRMMVKVEHLDDLKKAIPKESNPSYYGNNDVFLLQNLCVDENGVSTWKPDVWEFVKFHDASDDKYPNTYEFRYKTGYVEKPASDATMPALFTKITVPGSIDNTHLTYLKNVEIVVTAHAIQATGFTATGTEGEDGYKSAAENAWDAFDGQVNPPVAETPAT